MNGRKVEQIYNPVECADDACHEVTNGSMKCPEHTYQKMTVYFAEADLKFLAKLAHVEGVSRSVIARRIVKIARENR